VVLHSPYVRAAETANILMQRLDPARRSQLVIESDERLREKEFGVLDRLTTHGIAHHFPDLYEQRQHVGKFYFRPPGGESWCDVILRLRSVIDTMNREYCRERVLVVAHQVTVNCFRYLFERMDEKTILDFDRAGDVPNCSVTSYEYDPELGKGGHLSLRLVNFVAPLEATGTPVTASKDLPAAPKA
jgi:broad specificity phosphatase PhoE